MKLHTVIGGKILGGSQSKILKMAEVIALTHQEKWDGSGYPLGLKGEDIPLVGRITTICDVFDALTSERPYKREWSAEEAREYIQNEGGKHFDPRLTKVFLSIMPDVLGIQERFREGRHKETNNPAQE
jgi:putative two-component system response regulator